MANPTNTDLINSQFINQDIINNWSGTAPCEGLTLLDLRIRLRNELSNYVENSLISDDINNDIERQWINDGIGQLWPHDWQGVAKSFQMIPQQTIYYMPDDCEQVISVYTATKDLPSQQMRLMKVPHFDGWIFDNSFFDAVSLANIDTHEPWVNEIKKAVVIRDPGILSPMALTSVTPSRQSTAASANSYPWVIIRYARRWGSLTNDSDCINPTPNRIQAIVFYACSQYFNSQFQVSTESIRYQNYLQISQRFLQMSLQQLAKDSKPVYFS
jgi:hypothetical protein